MYLVVVQGRRVSIRVVTMTSLWVSRIVTQTMVDASWCHQRTVYGAAEREGPSRSAGRDNNSPRRVFFFFRLLFFRLKLREGVEFRASFVEDDVHSVKGLL